jgi:rhomboid protease GluP
MIVWSHRDDGPRAGLMLGPSPAALIRFGALYSPLVEEGQWWRLGTATLIHLDPLHLVFNAMSLWSVTTYLEEALGKAKTLALYVALGLTASATSLVYHVATDGYAYSAGASGAICGLIGVCVGFTLRRRNVARHLRGHYVGWAVWIGILAFSGWRIDNAAHFGGFIPGVLCGLLVRRYRDTGALSRQLWLAAAIVGVVAMLAMVVIAAATA